MTWQRFILILGGFSAGTATYADATHITAEAGVLHDHNLGRAEYGRDEQHDTALQGSAHISRSLRLSENSGLVARAGLQLTQQAHYDDLSLAAANGGIRYRLQPVPGFTMPWLDVALNAERLEYQDSDIRDGWIGTLTTGIGKYFTDKLRLDVGWIGERRHADDSRVFDLRNHGWQVGMDFRLSPQGSLYAKVQRLQGDQVSSAPQGSLSPSPLRYAAQTRDEALSEHGRGRNAYRFDARTSSIELGYNHALRGNLALDIGARYFEADADGGHTYEGYSTRAGLLYRF